MGESSPLAHSPTLSANGASDGVDRQLAAGAQVGDYVIERFIGAGAMGEVYAGKHPVIGKRVAIKVLRQELAASAEAAERFIREARAVNQIEHENVIDVFAFGRLDNGQLYLVMELVDGRSLRAQLVNGPLELGAALEILDVVADALDAAHAKGVVHRDLKPDNVVLSSATPPKVFVLDFGIAKLVSKANEADGTAKSGPGTLTGQGTWLGTPGYMAPEQWSVDGAGPASDRYALGVIAFELLSGAPPFSATSVPGMMEQHFRTPVPALSSRGAVGVPASVDAVLQRALAKDPDERFPTARAFVDALRDAAGTGAHRARGAVERPAHATKVWMPALAGAGVLGLGVVAFVATRHHDQAHTPAVAPVHDSAAHAGEIEVEILSSPAGAEVRTDHVIGVTPTKLSIKPGANVELTARKPGYLAAKQSIVASDKPSVVQLTLAEVSSFNGVWRLGNGQLRALERSGDQVAIYKVREVDGPREFFKNYAFTPAETGITFANDDEIVDPRKPDDPHCHVPVHTEYNYDPSTDALVVKLDKVEIDLVDGSCVVRSRKVISDTLVHLDHPQDTVEIPAPVGKPIAPTKSSKLKTIAPSDPQALKTSRKAPNVGKKQSVSDIGSMAKSNAPSDLGAQNAYSVGSKDSQIAPKVQVNPPTANAEPPPNQAEPQQQATPQQQAPQPQPAQRQKK